MERTRLTQGTAAPCFSSASHADDALPLFKVQLAPSRSARGEVGLFPLHMIERGEAVIHFDWREHAHWTPISGFPPHSQCYLHALWDYSGRPAVPNGLLLDPVCFLRRVASDHATVRFDARTGTYCALRALRPDDEITVARAAREDEEGADGQSSTLQHLECLRLLEGACEQGSPGNPVLRCQVAISKIKPNMVGMFPLSPIRAGQCVFHFSWRDHARTYPADCFRVEAREYMWRVWAGALPFSMIFDVVNFLNHTRHQPTVVYDRQTGDYLATRDLSTEDEITIDYVGYNDSGLNLFYDELSDVERAAVPDSWKHRFRPDDVHSKVGTAAPIPQAIRHAPGQGACRTDSNDCDGDSDKRTMTACDVSPMTASTAHTASEHASECSEDSEHISGWRNVRRNFLACFT